MRNQELILSLPKCVLEFDKPSCKFFGLICDESFTCRDLNLNPGHFRGSTLFYPCSSV
jgi:hypothetical protein